MTRIRSALILVATVTFMSPALAQDYLSGATLYGDVERYDSFGIHRYGTGGAEAAFDWITERLRAEELVVGNQDYRVGRQYFLDEANLTARGKTIPVVPQWWMPEDTASFSLTAPIISAGDSSGRFVHIHLPYDNGAYLNTKHRAAIEAAVARHPAAVLMTIDHPSGEIFTYNVDQSELPWTVPVILVAPKDEALLAAAEAEAAPVSVGIMGSYRKDVPGRNVIGRLDRGKPRTIIVSTPVTSWFNSTCERGPGIAAFLATVRLARTLTEVNFVFVATGGHEIGHGGMDVFIEHLAPRPEQVIAWVHYGASLACYQWARAGDHWVTAEADADCMKIAAPQRNNRNDGNRERLRSTPCKLTKEVCDAGSRGEAYEFLSSGRWSRNRRV
jgi:hypothetical protein